MFELPEEDKMAFCERHRLLGNFLYGEGVLPKAAEQYKTVRVSRVLELTISSLRAVLSGLPYLSLFASYHRPSRTTTTAFRRKGPSSNA